MTMTRTTLVLLVSLCLSALGSGTATAAAPEVRSDAAGISEPRLAVPPPTGPLRVSTRRLHLVDRSRLDPWRPRTGPRELMVTMTYPARRGGRAATYMTPRESRALLALQEEQGATLPPDLRRDVLSRVRVPATVGARPARHRGDGRPLVVLSPGFSMPRSSLTGLATELASRGFVVASVDHTFEAAGISLPRRRFAHCAACDVEDYSVIAPGRARDVSFVLDRLLSPRSRWSRIVDEDRIGMAGHSIGGNSAASTMAVDDRIDAGVNLDGTFFDRVRRDLDRPFLLMGTRDLHRPQGKDRTWPRAWRHFTSERTWLTVKGSNHSTFVDYPDLIEQLGLPGSGLSGRRSLRMTRAYVAAFFGEHLRSRRQPLLDGPSRRFPEVTFHRTGHR